MEQSRKERIFERLKITRTYWGDRIMFDEWLKGQLYPSLYFQQFGTTTRLPKTEGRRVKVARWVIDDVTSSKD